MVKLMGNWLWFKIGYGKIGYYENFFGLIVDLVWLKGE